MALAQGQLRTLSVLSSLRADLIRLDMCRPVEKSKMKIDSLRTWLFRKSGVVLFGEDLIIFKLNPVLRHLKRKKILLTPARTRATRFEAAHYM